MQHYDGDMLESFFHNGNCLRVLDPTLPDTAVSQWQSVFMEYIPRIPKARLSSYARAILDSMDPNTFPVAHEFKKCLLARLEGREPQHTEEEIVEEMVALGWGYWILAFINALNFDIPRQKGLQRYSLDAIQHFTQTANFFYERINARFWSMHPQSPVIDVDREFPLYSNNFHREDPYSDFKPPHMYSALR